MILTIYTVTTMIIAYLLGSIERRGSAKKYYGIDIREYGSKNAGTTNMPACWAAAALPVFAPDFRAIRP